MSVQRFRKGVEKGEGEGRRREDEEGHLRLTHDEEAQAFYTPDGELALSHDRVDLRHLFSGMREPEGGGSADGRTDREPLRVRRHSLLGNSVNRANRVGP
jgi:hypothetical protein